jgi:hypothetical protein
MWTESWVGTTRFIAAQGRPNIADVHTRSQTFNYFISLGDGGLLDTHFTDLLTKGSHAQTPSFPCMLWAIPGKAAQ